MLVVTRTAAHCARTLHGSSLAGSESGDCDGARESGGSQEGVRSESGDRELRSPGTRSEAGAAQQVEEETVRRMHWIYGILGEKEIYRRLGDTGYI